MINAYNSITYISLNNQSCMSGPNLIYLNPDECNPGLDYFPSMVNSDRCIESYTFDDPSTVIFVPSKTECVNLSVFNIVMRIND